MSPLRGRGSRGQQARFAARTETLGRAIDAGLAAATQARDEQAARLRAMGVPGRAAEIRAIVASLRSLGVREGLLSRIELDAETPIDVVVRRIHAEATS